MTVLMSASLHDDHATAKLHKWKHSNDVKVNSKYGGFKRQPRQKDCGLQLSLVCHEMTKRIPEMYYQNILLHMFFLLINIFPMRQ